MTPAIDLLTKRKIVFVAHEYEHDPNSHSYGMEAAEKLGFDPARVFKTLVVVDERDRLFVGMVAVSKQLNLKKLAAALKVKKLSMAEAKRVERVSGNGAKGCVVNNKMRPRSRRGPARRRSAEECDF